MKEPLKLKPLPRRHPHRIALECMYMSNLGLSLEEARERANKQWGVPED
ncbi:hypothetical protein SEA_PANAMAXUS_77 [Mycobacterium phage Panamaxus]|uniref:Uncharacterized protein n=1 Tax=Mycobacterium phage Veracruz TaxID=2530154 RepID=A0A481VTP3_9CAUD|nr:hypothetical protein KIP27_gp15 [Mycobacterium phage Veracruz]AIS73753.1 hypothetical protein PBI_QUINNKIRO_79 [Mycobacterium phage QuinnKiro]ALA11881.1 hypothetical protein SEA_TEXAGE_78 [Mycobacterium phage Texage]AOT24228.1 hypothetical protein SEA_TODACORO_80 [Mycobacterium phage Todacoro]AOT25581.1 hypothetical protein SEA_MARGO_80 [Mycobacterium phage Margo]AUX82375.1 hypothetical protein SEA_LAMBERT1_80 [Mycobacterium phage Lambert1]AVP42993.1 hypothetical protein SEA_PANAMAXUS_77 [